LRWLANAVSLQVLQDALEIIRDFRRKLYARHRQRAAL
jgi:hypothetical protein